MLFRSHLVCRSGLATPKKAPRITDMPRYFFSEYRRLLLPTYSAFGWLKPWYPSSQVIWPGIDGWYQAGHCTAFFKIQLTTLRVPNSIHWRAESSSYDHPPLFRRSHGRWVQRKSVKRDIIHNNAAICSFVGKGLHGHSALNNLLNKLRFHLIIVVFISFLKTNKFHLIIYKRYRQRERYHIIIRKFAQSN